VGSCTFRNDVTLRDNSSSRWLFCCSRTLFCDDIKLLMIKSAEESRNNAGSAEINQKSRLTAHCPTFPFLPTPAIIQFRQKAVRTASADGDLQNARELLAALPVYEDCKEHLHLRKLLAALLEHAPSETGRQLIARTSSTSLNSRMV